MSRSATSQLVRTVGTPIATPFKTIVVAIVERHGKRYVRLTLKSPTGPRAGALLDRVALAHLIATLADAEAEAPR